MALGMADLVFADGLGQEEGTPVRYAADDAVGGENEGAGGTCDSGEGRKIRLGPGRRQQRRWCVDVVRRGKILFDF